ncbi:MAG: response regulator [Chloroflexales bacterium]|nr:response regulator [Chloroflexales bacterium]
MLDPSELSLEQVHEELRRLRARVAALEGTAISLSEGLTGPCAQILDQIHDAVIVTDAAMQVRFWNRAAAQLYGWSREEAVGRSVSEVVPVVRYCASETTAAAALAALHAEGRWHGEVVQRHRDGHEVVVVATVQWMTSATDAPPAFLAVNRDISDRLRSEEWLRTVTETARVGLAVVDAAHRYQYANQTYKEFQQLPFEDLTGRHVAEVLGSLYERFVRQRLERALSGERIHDYLVLPLPSGAEERRYLARVEPGHDPHGPLAVVVLTDITEQTRVEAALRASEERLRLALQAANQGLYDVHTPSGAVAVSPEYALMLGYDPATFHETTTIWQERLHPDDVAHATKAYRACLAGETPAFAAEFRERMADGRWIWLLSRGKIIAWDAQGRPLRMLGTRTDITARKQAELARERATARLDLLAEASRTFSESALEYQHLLDQIARALVPTLGDGCVLALPVGGSVRILPHTIYDIDPEREELHRRHIDGAKDGDEPPLNGRVFRTQQPVFLPSVDLKQLQAATNSDHAALLDRLRPHSVIIVPMRARGQSVGVLTLYRYLSERPSFDEEDLKLAQDLADRAALAIRNVQLLQLAQAELAERKQAEAALAAERALLARRVAERTADLSTANAELARAARLKDEFLASMSHELRTPLNAILARSEILREGIYGALVPKQDGAIQSIEEASRHLLALINDILDLSKIEAERLQLETAVVSVDQVSRAATRMVAQLAVTKRIGLSSTVDSTVTTIVADERRLKQILVNLLTNAVKFTPEGGKVGLEVAGDHEAQTLTFTVWDTGIGIAPEDQQRLFQPFVQIDSSLSREHSGTGLGLSLVLRLAELHGGSVALESSPGQGSRFSVVLPWSEPAPTPPPQPALAPSAPQAGPLATAPSPIRQTLVIEDSLASASQLSHYLAEVGSKVVVHPRACGAYEQARALRPDLIVLDILLPDQPGWDVLGQLKADPVTAPIPVLVASVVDDAPRACALGAASFVLKPLIRDVFLEALRQIQSAQVSAEAPAIAITLVVAPESPAPRPQVLVVDDNEANLQVLRDYLATAGYEVVAARNGAEAVALAEELRPAVILMDIQMPVLDGLEATRRIRAAGLQTPIIALTALAMRGDRERCLAVGASEYLAKPVNLRALVATMAAQLQAATTP